MAETVMLETTPPSFTYLIQTTGMRRGAIYHLRGTRTAIGRTGDANDIVLGDDVAISSHHAHVRCEPDGRYYLLDMDSSNGSFVNGARIHRQELRSGDRVRLGKTDLVFKRLG